MRGQVPHEVQGTQLLAVERAVNAPQHTRPDNGSTLRDAQSLHLQPSSPRTRDTLKINDSHSLHAAMILLGQNAESNNASPGHLNSFRSGSATSLQHEDTQAATTHVTSERALQRAR
jgi:hypothetical protein